MITLNFKNPKIKLHNILIIFIITMLSSMFVSSFSFCNPALFINNRATIINTLITSETFTVTYAPGNHGDFENDIHRNLKLGESTPNFTGPTDSKGNPIGKDGYSFKGWAPEISKTVLEDKTYVAQWIMKDSLGYNVSYQYSGVVPIDAPRLPTTTSYFSGNKVTIASTPDLEGYIFSGWSSNDVTVDENSFTMPSKNVVLTGSWSKVSTSFTVTYAPGKNGDFYSDVHSGLKFGQSTPSFSGPTNGNGQPLGYDGYSFKGWDPEISETVTSNKTYVAQWLVFGESGGGSSSSGEYQSDGVEYAEPASFVMGPPPTLEPAYINYTIKHVYLTTDVNGVQTIKGEEVVKQTAKPGTEIDLNNYMDPDYGGTKYNYDSADLDPDGDKKIELTQDGLVISMKYNKKLAKPINYTVKQEYYTNSRLDYFSSQEFSANVDDEIDIKKFIRSSFTSDDGLNHEYKYIDSTPISNNGIIVLTDQYNNLTITLRYSKDTSNLSSGNENNENNVDGTNSLSNNSIQSNFDKDSVDAINSISDDIVDTGEAFIIPVVIIIFLTIGSLLVKLEFIKNNK